MSILVSCGGVSTKRRSNKMFIEVVDQRKAI